MTSSDTFQARNAGFCGSCRTVYAVGTTLALRNGSQVHAECKLISPVAPVAARKLTTEGWTTNCRRCGSLCSGECYLY